MHRIVALTAAVLAVSAAPAAAKDYADTARNILPGGQYGAVPPPPGADTQALMYDALTPLFDHVTDADIQSDFKSEGFGVGPDGPARREAVPRKGVTIVRGCCSRRPAIRPGWPPSTRRTSTRSGSS